MIFLYKGDNNEVIPKLKVRPNIIYLDPPYNTKNDSMTFSDNLGDFEKWSVFFEERLIKIKQIIAKDAVIFTSIDQLGLPYAQIALNKVFGVSSFVASMPRRTISVAKTTKTISKVHEYLIINKIGKVEFNNNLPIPKRDYKLIDKHFKTRGHFQLRPLDYKDFRYSKTLDFPISLNGETFYPNGKQAYEDRIKFSYAKDWCWLWSKKRVDFAIKNDYIVVKNSRLWKKTYTKAEISRNKGEYFINYQNRCKPYCSDVMLEKKYSRTKNKTRYEKLFSYSKSHVFLTFIFCLPKFENKIILDPFAGTGASGIVANLLGYNCHLIQKSEIIKSNNRLSQVKINDIFDLLVKNLEERDVMVEAKHGV